MFSVTDLLLIMIHVCDMICKEILTKSCLLSVVIEKCDDTAWKKGKVIAHCLFIIL